jgi:LuxR family transcriptional regulator, maltose regulon positive regulatory protein
MDRLFPIKLALPRQPDRRVARPRVDRLLDGVPAARLILVSAPPGFGKTTALVDWLAASGARCAWLSLDESDNDQVRFLRYLWAAVVHVGVPLDGEPPEAARLAEADPIDVVGEIATLLGNQPDPVYVVLDDYHVIEAPEVHRSVAFLLDHLPGQAHLAIATRADPALPLGRLRARGELLEIRGETLRFTVPEGRAFLVDRMGLHLSDADIEALVARTEGWPAALQLAGLSLVGREDVGAFVRDFAGTHRFVLDFITEEVLERLTPSASDFLLRTSVLDRLTGPLCDALTGESDGQTRLEELERANQLLLPLDEERRWYRYHQLFADLLRARLVVVHPGEAPALHLRAADWYEAHGRPGEAVEHTLRSGDGSRARIVFRKHSKDFVHAGEFATLRGWLDRLPGSAVRDDPQLSTTYAWTIALSGQTDDVAERLADAESALRTPATEATDSRAAVIPTQIACIRSIVARLEDDPRAAVGHAERALELVPDGLPPAIGAMFTGDAEALLGHALLDAGDIDGAIDAYRLARPLLVRAGNRLAVADITRNLARLQARRGRLRAALDACDEALAEVASATMSDAPALAAIHLARAEILERLGETGADGSADRAIELAARAGDMATLRDARALRARIAARPAADRGRDSRPGPELVESLTERELEVLRLVAAGKSNRQIAAELYLALGTVKAHVHAISGKLGAANRVEAIVRGRELGLLG